MFFCKNRVHQYIVTLEVNGRHPYLVDHDLDYFEGKKDVQVKVTATSWKKADQAARDVGPCIKAWSWRVKSIEKVFKEF